MKLNGTKSELNINRLLIGTFDEQISFCRKGKCQFKNIAGMDYRHTEAKIE